MAWGCFWKYFCACDRICFDVRDGIISAMSFHFVYLVTYLLYPFRNKVCSQSAHLPVGKQRISPIMFVAGRLGDTRGSRGVRMARDVFLPLVGNAPLPSAPSDSVALGRCCSAFEWSFVGVIPVCGPTTGVISCGSGCAGEGHCGSGRSDGWGGQDCTRPEVCALWSCVADASNCALDGPDVEPIPSNQPVIHLNDTPGGMIVVIRNRDSAGAEGARCEQSSGGKLVVVLVVLLDASSEARLEVSVATGLGLCATVAKRSEDIRRLCLFWMVVLMVVAAGFRACLLPRVAVLWLVL